MIQPERLTAQLDGDFVVFLIGMRINHLWKLHKWWPVATAMPRMLKELAQHPEKGFLGRFPTGGGEGGGLVAGIAFKPDACIPLPFGDAEGPRCNRMKPEQITRNALVGCTVVIGYRLACDGRPRRAGLSARVGDDLCRS